MQRWDAERFEKLVFERFDSMQAFAQAAGASVAGVKNWMPQTGPTGAHRQRVLDALGVDEDQLFVSSDPGADASASPISEERIEAKLDEALELLRGIAGVNAADAADGDTRRTGATDDALAAARQAVEQKVERAARRARAEKQPRAPQAGARTSRR